MKPSCDWKEERRVRPAGQQPEIRELSGEFRCPMGFKKINNKGDWGLENFETDWKCNEKLLLMLDLAKKAGRMRSGKIKIFFNGHHTYRKSNLEPNCWKLLIGQIQRMQKRRWANRAAGAGRVGVLRPGLGQKWALCIRFFWKKNKNLLAAR